MPDRADHLPLLQKAFRYGVVGMINTAIHFLTTIALVELDVLEPVSASSLGFSVAVIVSFFLNRHWTFSRTDKAVQRLWRFLVVSLSGLGLNAVIMFVVVDWMRWNFLLGLLIILVVLPPYTFLLNWRWSFRGDS